MLRLLDGGLASVSPERDREVESNEKESHIVKTESRPEAGSGRHTLVDNSCRFWYEAEGNFGGGVRVGFGLFVRNVFLSKHVNKSNMLNFCLARHSNCAINIDCGMTFKTTGIHSQGIS